MTPTEPQTPTEPRPRGQPPISDLEYRSRLEIARICQDSVIDFGLLFGGIIVAILVAWLLTH